MGQQKTHVEVEDDAGRTFLTEVGVDGKNPVTPNNPPAKAAGADEPKQPRFQTIEGKGKDVTPNNPLVKTQDRISEDVYNPEADDNSPNEPSRATTEDDIEDATDGPTDPAEVEYAETAVGTYHNEDGLLKATEPGSDEEEKADPKPAQTNAEELANDGSSVRESDIDVKEPEGEAGPTGSTDSGSDDGEDGPPAKGATRDEWDEYAKSKGASDEEIEGFKNKDEVIAAYGNK